MNYPEESAIKMYVKILSFNRTILEEEIKEKPVEQNLSKNWTCKMTRCRLCWSVGNLSSVLGINGSQVCFSMFHFNNKNSSLSIFFTRVALPLLRIMST